jgi:heterodisulfide reductase subunit C2
MGPTKRLLDQLLSEEKLGYCLNCGMCTASCPMARVIPDTYNPRLLLQRAHLDLDGLTDGEELWLCSWCYRCTERCPQGIQPTEIFLLARNFASEKGNIPPNPKAIMRTILRTGRSMPVDEFTNELREDYGLPLVEPVSEKALEEQRRITGEEFRRRIEG